MPDFWDQFRTDLSPADTTALRQSRTLAAPPEPPPAAPGWMAAAPQAAGFAATLGGPSMAGLAGAGTEAIAQVLGGLGDAQQLGAFPRHGLDGLRRYAAGSPAEALGRRPCLLHESARRSRWRMDTHAVARAAPGR